MPEAETSRHRRSTESDDTSTTSTKAAAPATDDDAAAAEATAQEQGYRGVADKRDRADYTVASGPDSPDLEAQLEARRDEIDAQLEELKANREA